MYSENIILFSTADWDAPYLTNKQHTAKLLGKRGFRVLYVESIGLRAPTANKKDIKRIWQRLKKGLSPIREVENNVWLLSPLGIPFKQNHKLISWINQGLLRLRISSFLRSSAFKEAIVWTYHPYIFGAIRNQEIQSLIYHCVDDLSAIPGVDSINFLDREKFLLRKCNHVFVTNRQLFRKCEIENSSVHYMSNVTDVDHFIQAHANQVLPSILLKVPKPRICYIGALSDYKIDFELLYKIVSKRTDWSLVLIGDERGSR